MYIKEYVNKMDYVKANSEIWDIRAENNDIWSIPVTSEAVELAKNGIWNIVLTPSKTVPMDWFPNEIKAKKVLCLASGGGQQGHIIAALGADVTVFDNSKRQLEKDEFVSQRDGLNIKTVQGDMKDLSVFDDEYFVFIIHHRKERANQMMFYKNGKLIVRSLEYSDKYLIIKWLSDNEVLKYYEGRDNPYDEEMVEEKFYKRNVNKTRCIIEYSQTPIGYIQFYSIGQKECEEYGYENVQDTIFGTDQFIGETKYWGQGIGKVLIKSMENFLITEKGAKKIILDPQVWNERAIRCYEKSGFIKTKILPKHELHEGELKDCWLMEYSVDI